MRIRLEAINALVKKWIEGRMNRTAMTKRARKLLIESLEDKRKRGMRMLAMIRTGENGLTIASAPAYATERECAVCNAAVGKPMALPKK